MLDSVVGSKSDYTKRILGGIMIDAQEMHQDLTIDSESSERVHGHCRARWYFAYGWRQLSGCGRLMVGW